MKIDKELISRLEHLARLDLSDEQKKSLLKDMNDILLMVEKLKELPTNDVEPLIYINEQGNVWREDKVDHQVDRSAALANAPDKNEEFFKVPKVIDL